MPIEIINLPCVSFDLVEFGDAPRQCLRWVTFRVTVRLSFYIDSSLNAVSVIVSRSHIALVQQNPQWPIPRYTDLPQHPKGPAFVRLARHKISDVTSLVCDTICF